MPTNESIRQTLAELGYTGQINDSMFRFLSDNGYSGQLLDMFHEWIGDGMPGMTEDYNPMELFEDGISTGSYVALTSSILWKDLEKTQTAGIGETVAVIESLTGTGDLVQTDPAKRATRTSTGIYFDGMNSFYDTGQGTDVNPYTILVCFDIHVEQFDLYPHLYGTTTGATGGGSNRTIMHLSNYKPSVTNRSVNNHLERDPLGTRLSIGLSRSAETGTHTWVGGEPLINYGMERASAYNGYVGALNAAGNVMRHLHGNLVGYLRIDKTLSDKEVKKVHSAWNKLFVNELEWDVRTSGGVMAFHFETPTPPGLNGTWEVEIEDNVMKFISTPH